MKKFLSITFVFTAYFLLLLHSVIPHHHHHEEFSEHHGATGSGAQDDHDMDNNLLANAFSLLQHDTDGAIVYESVSTTFKYSKVNIDPGVIFHADPVINIIHKPPLLYSYPVDFHLSSSFAATLQFRGPPVPLG